MARPTLSDKRLLAQVPAARRRAAAERTVARTARYDRRHRRVHVELSSGAILQVPVDLIPTLRHARDSELSEVRVGTAGMSLRWDRLDEDVTIAGLARVALGRGVLMRASGAAGGGSRSAAKSRAARANGLKGGRPRKIPVTRTSSSRPVAAR